MADSALLPLTTTSVVDVVIRKSASYFPERCYFRNGVEGRPSVGRLVGGARGYLLTTGNEMSNDSDGIAAVALLFFYIRINWWQFLKVTIIWVWDETSGQINCYYSGCDAFGEILPLFSPKSFCKSKQILAQKYRSSCTSSKIALQTCSMLMNGH